MRTPLSSIIAFTDIWEKSDRVRDAEEERLVGKIKESSSSLLNMVNNTIDVARLEAGSLALQIDETDLVDVMGAVFATAEPLALQQSVALSKFIDPAIPVMRTDGEALRKIMLNLVGNALKFTPPGGSVAVEAHLECCDKWVRLSVTDTGFGIASEDCERIRVISPDVPVLMLTAKGDIVDKKIGFHAGADDYMVKPFNDEELLLRVEALLRRRGRGESSAPSAIGQVVTVGDMTIDPRRCEVAVAGKAVALTPKEFQIVATMAESPGKVFTREDLIELVWGRDYDAGAISIPVYIRRIREKVEADPSNPVYVQTVWGFGYRLGGE